MREAFYLARTGRPGPVLVDITKDAQQSQAEFDCEAAAPRPHGRPGVPPQEHHFREALALINAAERPVILAGHGILLGNAMAEFKAFAERTHIPVALTLLGLGAFPASHPLNLGMMGMHGEAWVNTAIQEADLLIALGMRFDDRVTGRSRRYAPNAKKIHVEIDPAEINKNVRGRRRLIGDVRDVLARLTPAIAAGDRTRLADEDRRPQGWRRPCATSRTLPDDGHLYAAHVIHDLWRATDGKALVVTDVGQHQMWEAQYYQHDVPRSLITSGGLGTMGFALPAAIGAKFARPNEEVWVVVGDGGFQMTVAELSTIAQEGINVNIAIINNGYLGMVRQWQEFFYERRYAATPLLSPDFVKLAEAHGLRGSTCGAATKSTPPCRRRARRREPCSSTSASSRKTPSTRWCRPARHCTR